MRLSSILIIVFILSCSALKAQVWHNQLPVSFGINSGGSTLAQNLGMNGIGWNIQASYLHLVVEDDLFLKGSVGYLRQPSSVSSDFSVSMASGTVGVHYVLGTKTYQPYVGIDIGFAGTSNTFGVPSALNSSHGLIRFNAGMVLDLARFLYNNQIKNSSIARHLDPFISAHYSVLTGNNAPIFFGVNIGVNVRLTD